jgi:hypothetical protein
VCSACVGVAGPGLSYHQHASAYVQKPVNVYQFMRTVVKDNTVRGNHGRQLNSGGIVVASAAKLTKGANPSHDTIVGNRAFLNRPADLIWDGTGVANRFVRNHCGKSIPRGLCH